MSRLINATVNHLVLRVGSSKAVSNVKPLSLLFRVLFYSSFLFLGASTDVGHESGQQAICIEWLLDHWSLKSIVLLLWLFVSGCWCGEEVCEGIIVCLLLFFLICVVVLGLRYVLPVPEIVHAIPFSVIFLKLFLVLLSWDSVRSGSRSGL